MSRRLKILLLTAILLSGQHAVAQQRVGQRLPPIYTLLFEEPRLSRFEQVLKAYNDGEHTDYVFIAAHRGGKEFDVQDQAPGNSIANIDNATSKLFDIYESDIEILLGGNQDTLVVFHDDTFDNLTNTTQQDDRLNDADLDYAQSLRLTYDNGTVSDEKIATLEQFLRATKDKIMVKFDLKSDVFTQARLSAILQTIVDTQTTDQVLIRGGGFVLDVAKENGFDTRIIMRRYNAAPTIDDLNKLTTDYDVKAISIPNGADAVIIQTAIDLGLIVEVHDPQGVSDQERELGWQASYDLGVRQFHSFKPTLLKSYLESQGYRDLK